MSDVIQFIEDSDWNVIYKNGEKIFSLCFENDYPVDFGVLMGVLNGLGLNYIFETITLDIDPTWFYDNFSENWDEDHWPDRIEDIIFMDE